MLSVAITMLDYSALSAFPDRTFSINALSRDKGPDLQLKVIWLLPAVFGEDCHW